MSKFVDSRDPIGGGFLILQDHGYKQKAVADHNRGSLVGVRVIGRNDEENEGGEWREDELARGPIGGGMFWDRAKTNAGAYQFGWPSIVAQGGWDPIADSPLNTPMREGPSPTTGNKPKPQPEAGGGGGGAGGGPAGEQTAIDAENRLRRDPGVPLVSYKYKGKIQKPAGGGAFGVFGLNKGAFLQPWGGAGGIWNPRANKGAGAFVGGVFGQGLKWLDANFVQLIPNIWKVPGTKGDKWGKNKFYELQVEGIFGVGVDAYGINIVGAASAKDIRKKIAKHADDRVFEFFLDSESVSESRLSLKVFPGATGWKADGRYNPKSPATLTGWPDFPWGWATLTMHSSVESQQDELCLPVDPRLVAANVGNPYTCGSVVMDITGEGAVDLNRCARLQSAWRVIVHPTRHKTFEIWDGRSDKPDVKHTEKEFSQNWLAWQLGPSGQMDTYGGIVCDLPQDSTFAPVDRVLAMVSARDGGPFDVGTAGDIHHWGVDGDGNPINSLHIQTEALFREIGSNVFDGPLHFEHAWPDPGELPYPVMVHMGWMGTKWGWWSTALYKTTTPRDPRDPQPPPEEGPPNEGPPRPTSPPDDSPPIEGGRDPYKPVALGITHMDTSFPAISFRAQPLGEGLIDYRHARQPGGSKFSAFEDMAPIVARMQAYGAQGGVASNYLAAGQGTDFVYSQSPGRSWYRGGTAAGSLAFMGPNDDLCYVDQSMAPGGMTRATSYLMTVTGSWFGAGLPELSGGGVKTGASWGADTNGDLAIRAHDATGAVTDTVLSRDLWEYVTKAAAFNPGDLHDVQVGSQKQLGVRTDAGNEALAVNIGGTVFTTALA